MTLTHYGKDVWLKMLAIAVILDVLVFCSALMRYLNPLTAFVMICVIMLIWLAAVSFFRDPKRKIPTDPALVLSPADGTVRDIELIKSESVECEELRDLFQVQDMLRVGIFLSVFSV
ncbi:MAG: phosphatidylserine decarboxylase, partial [Lentisphaeria bacterium]|nr:phosphatidylserine decarboxylase [Lentisphaeria bacterium]